MKSEQKRAGGLLYREEHFICEGYVSDDRAIIGLVELEAGRLFIREDVKRSTLVFVLSGDIDISTGSVLNRRIKSGNMFLVPAGSSFYGKASTATVLIRYSFTVDIALCNRFAIKNLLRYLPDGGLSGRNDFVTLPVRDLLRRELELTRDLMREGLLCVHFQQMRLEIMFMELRGFYRKEELAGLFAPILGVEEDFKDRVLQTFPEVNSAKELMERLNMSPTVFKQKFHASFGVSAKQWLIQKKKEKLLRDILMTDCTVSELAEKYSLTVNYLTTFCKKHFGKTPTELRLQWNG